MNLMTHEHIYTRYYGYLILSTFYWI